MSSEAGKPTGPNKQLDHELHDMFTSITNRVTDLHKSRLDHGHEDEDEHGVSIITLAGNNSGATLRSELDDDHQDNPRKRGGHRGLHHGGANGDPEGMNTYVNSNFQAVNNSVMMGGSYTTNDPGVHLDIADFFEPHGHSKPEKKGGKGKEKEKKKEKEKEKEKESFQSDQHQEHDDAEKEKEKEKEKESFQSDQHQEHDDAEKEKESFQSDQHQEHDDAFASLTL